jgi:hypothetical protein
VQQNDISQERREFFLREFSRYVKFDADTDPNFLNSFSNHILTSTTEEYLNFEADPISFCRGYLNSFYSEDKYTSSKEANFISHEEKTYISWLLNQVNAESIAALKKSIANTHARTPATEPIDWTSNKASAIAANPVVNDVESEKTESSSEPQIVTTSDSEADDAASEKTEES